MYGYEEPAICHTSLSFKKALYMQNRARGPSLVGRPSSSKPRCGKTSSHGKEIEIDRRYRDLSRAAGLLKGAELRLICLADLEMTDSDSTFSNRSSSAVSPTEGPTESQDSVRTVSFCQETLPISHCRLS